MMYRRCTILVILLGCWTACSRTATKVYERNSTAVVTVQTLSSLGSGVLVDPSGVIVTNLHVVEGASSITITLADGDAYDDVNVINVDRRRDLAILKIQGTRFPSVEFGDSDTLSVGQPVFALGAPQGLALTISEGIVSSRRDSGSGFQVIQTTAAMSPGSSGGGLFDDAGRLVGITTFKLEAGESLNFAIPVSYVRGMLSIGPEATLAERIGGLFSQTLNLDGVKTAVEEGLESQLGVPIASVTCPESREAKAGDSFECTAAGEHEGQVIVKVTQTDDQGNINWEVAKSTGYLDLTALIQQITSGIEEQAGVDVTVTCDGKYREARPGASFECTATDPDGKAHAVAVTMTDAEGNVDWKIVTEE